ncbi:aldehyde dehydrogenase PuuC [Pseudomonas sp. SWI36]|uniref:aldehyde dehydrogenase n=1 Tax=Pseudomonas sp. SWI36 TaxID=2083052 RepID=UPI000CE5E178|nr:aldehyde dehydrogenase [Pseudomonas sp. SWI36]AVD95056.1 aldehyde dehydrogenase PuuC [Pseudomonas sp. SWI36]
MDALARHPIYAQYWHDKARQQPYEGRCFINGRFVEALDGGVFDCYSPIDGRFLARIASGKSADVDLAVASARTAFEDRRWAGMPLIMRKQILNKLANLVLARKDELALLETMDMGKPISSSWNVDIPAVAQCFQWYAEAIDKLYEDIAPTSDGHLGMITREPLGVVGAIVPWNYPLLTAAWKVAPALAMGNSVILKPAEQSPLTAIRLAQLAIEAGVPKGVLNVVPGLGRTAGKALALHNDVDGILFTGSTATGRLLMEYTARSNLKKVSLELGGKSPSIILSSYSDIEKAASIVAERMFSNQVQTCIAPSRLIVERSVHSRVVDAVMKVAEMMQPADPLSPATRVGAVVDARHADRVMGYIERAVTSGAQLITGGQRAFVETGGSYIVPTIFDNVSNDMEIVREEVFGPVLSIITVDSATEAVAVANDTSYGLGAGVWCDKLSEAHQIAKKLRAGVVYVNCYNTCDLTTPFGGIKQSGHGRDKSMRAFDECTSVKTTLMDIKN